MNPYEPPSSTPEPLEHGPAIDVTIATGTEKTLTNFGCAMLAIGFVIAALVWVIDWIASRF